jgi:uncharacterized repeat protein (TIGR01451 family)
MARMGDEFLSYASHRIDRTRESRGIMNLGIRRAAGVAVGWAASAMAFAGINSWSAIGPAGGPVYKVAFAAKTPSTVFAVSDAGFHRSTDGASSWQLAATFADRPVDLAVDPSNPNRLYLMFEQPPNVFVSTDAGLTLQPVSVFPAGVSAGSKVQVSSDGQTVCVSGDWRVFCSTDGGHSWRERAPLSSPCSSPACRVTKLLIDPTNANTLYAATWDPSGTPPGGSLFVSHDGAASWQLLNGSVPYIADLAINPSNPNQVWAALLGPLWLSTDAGAHWTSLSGFPSGATATTVAIDSINPTVVYVGAHVASGARTVAALFSTSDQGVHWTEVTGNLALEQVSTIAIDPSMDSHILVGGANGLAGTTSSGTSWWAQTNGLIATSIIIMSADSTSDRIYLATDPGDAYYFANGGAAVTPLGQINNGVSGFYALPGLSGTLLASGDTSPGGIFKSSDGGASWNWITVPALGPPNGCCSETLGQFASSPGAPNTIVAATSNHGTPYRSVDAGASWTAITTGLPNAPFIYTFATATSDPRVVYAGLSDANGALGVYRSTDGGQSWVPANSGISTSSIGLLAVDPSDAQVVYAWTFANAILKTTDGGVTWKQTAWAPAAGVVGGQTGLAIDPVHPKILYVAQGAISRSVDGGGTWEVLRDAQAPPRWDGPLLVDPNRPSNILIGTQRYGAQLLTVAPDLALQVSAPTSALQVSVPASYLYTVTNKGPFHATGVQLTLSVPSGTQNASATAAAGACTTAATAVRCSLGILHSGASATVNLSATPAQTGAFQITGSVQADQPDANTTNNAVSTTMTVVSGAAPRSGGGGAFSTQWLIALLVLLLTRVRTSCDSHR